MEQKRFEENMLKVLDRMEQALNNIKKQTKASIKGVRNYLGLKRR